MMNSISNIVVNDENQTKSHISNYWLITFTDLISLMVAFFVMLYAISTPKDEELYKYKVDGMDKAEKTEGKDINIRKKASIYGLHRTFSRRAVSIQYLEAVLSSKVEENTIFNDVLITNFEDRLVISLPLLKYLSNRNSIIDVKEGKEDLFFEIAEMLENIVNKTDVRVFLGEKSEKNNVALSLAYAAKVRNLLLRSGNRKNISISTSEKDKIIGQLRLNDVMKEAYQSRIDIIINSEGQTID